MATKEISSTNKRKYKRPDEKSLSVMEKAQLALKEAKKNTEKEVLVTIDHRTSIVLPAHLSQEEMDDRVAQYIERRKLKK